MAMHDGASDAVDSEAWLTADGIAELSGGRVKPNTVRQHLCNRGSYYGVKPEKRANGHNYWPAIVPTQSA